MNVEDLDALVAANWYAPTAPVFVLVQLLESFSPSGRQEWMLLQYIPDRAAVRDKMLFASSKGALLKALGESKIVDVLTGSVVVRL
jgi:twinfilin-like protein